MEQFEREGHNDVIFFVGAEVEQTPAFAKKTLFVVGYQDTTTIEKHAKENNVPHIYLGANHSFDTTNKTKQFSKMWNDQINYFLGKGFWVTLDYQAHQHVDVLTMLDNAVWKNRLFVPLLAVRIPHVETSSPNLTVKIDDIDFKGTNPGVWCMHFTEVTDNNRFTGWGEYGDDTILSETGAKDRRIYPVDVGDVSTEKAEEIIQDIKDQLNNSELGLDLNTKSLLKPEPGSEIITETKILSTKDAASVYATGLEPKVEDKPVAKVSATKATTKTTTTTKNTK
jgi:hypothetical protein